MLIPFRLRYPLLIGCLIIFFIAILLAYWNLTGTARRADSIEALVQSGTAFTRNVPPGIREFYVLNERYIANTKKLKREGMWSSEIKALLDKCRSEGPILSVADSDVAILNAYSELANDFQSVVYTHILHAFRSQKR